MASDYDRIRLDNIRDYGEKTQHLELLKQLYSDRTHFVYELLQNAEDAGARKVAIESERDRLVFLHDGRPFNEADVRGICGVGEGTKLQDFNQIGKFGIGFKSVYAYTSSPEIHCGDEHFRIEHFVRPSRVVPVSIDAPWTTKIILPLDESSRTQSSEIDHRLRSLDVRTLLFLRNIGEIAWRSSQGQEGLYLRTSKPRGEARQVTLLGEIGTAEQEEENWLVFERPVASPQGDVNKPVEIAYRIERIAQGKRIGEEQITRLHQSPLFVFFATEKLTHLGFLIQGPFRTTPARDNIPKDDLWNKGLVAEVVTLLNDSLHQLKEMDLLTASVLEVMPIQEEDFPEGSMFRELYDRFAAILRDESFLPSVGGKFITARQAVLGRGGRDQKAAFFRAVEPAFSTFGVLCPTRLVVVEWPHQ